MFAKKSYVADQTSASPSTYTNAGFLNKRPGNTDNDFHRTLDSMVHEINGDTLKNKNENNAISVINVIPEDLKGKRYKDLTPKELQELGQISASQDRFRHRFHLEDYQSDVDRTASANIKWLD